jgi:hypothetical protein
MAKVRFGNHSSVLVPRRVRDDVRKLEIPDPHLYFRAPGGQCLRLFGIDEDMSFYEGVKEGSDVARMKEALRRESEATP